MSDYRLNLKLDKVVASKAGKDDIGPQVTITLKGDLTRAAQLLAAWVDRSFWVDFTLFGLGQIVPDKERKDGNVQLGLTIDDKAQNGAAHVDPGEFAGAMEDMAAKANAPEGDTA